MNLYEARLPNRAPGTMIDAVVDGATRLHIMKALRVPITTSIVGRGVTQIRFVEAICEAFDISLPWKG